MQPMNEDGSRNTEYESTVRALKAARLLKGYSRKDAAKLLGWTPRSFEQIENGRCNFSDERLHKIVACYGYSLKEFERIKCDPNLALAQVCEQKKDDRSIARKPRRNHYKIITKEVRVIRVLRLRKGISQYHASRLCGYVPGAFGQIEEGRIELKENRMEHILKSLGYKRADFQGLMAAPILRDEVIDEAVAGLRRLDDQSLSSAVNVIKALIK